VIVEAAVCPKCKVTVWSRHGHDMRFCSCGYCFIDGGRGYTRMGFGGDEWPKPWEKPEMIQLEVPEPK
jgi:hypothetical protein